MLFNLSYNDSKVEAKLLELVGKPFSLKDRIKLKGVGSPKFVIAKASMTLNNILLLDQNVNWCNVELRQKGIVIRFRKLLETYGFVVPFYKLVLYKTDLGYTVHKDNQYIIMQSNDKEALKKFVDKFLALKAIHLTDQLDF